MCQLDLQNLDASAKPSVYRMLMMLVKSRMKAKKAQNVESKQHIDLVFQFTNIMFSWIFLSQKQ